MIRGVSALIVALVSVSAVRADTHSVLSWAWLMLGCVFVFFVFALFYFRQDLFASVTHDQERFDVCIEQAYLALEHGDISQAHDLYREACGLFVFLSASAGSSWVDESHSRLTALYVSLDN